ncbi:MAG: transcriptional regulator NrdR [Bilifractor sp.]|jgi:transcriptional repressor NrdR
MKCPYCGAENNHVVDTRPVEEENSIRRRRICDSCNHRFTTYEKIETIPLMVIKKDRNREQYDRNKILGGILRACHKRPVPVQKINDVVDQIETEIFNMEEKEIESSVIGEIVMKYLIDLDAVAYVRFASVYREFKDVNTFMDELTKLLKQQGGEENKSEEKQEDEK